jgi:FMN phosphatase YigB (HAD superfamily)
VIGAATYGFRSIWVNRSAAPLDQLGQPPQPTVADLAELADAHL